MPSMLEQHPGFFEVLDTIKELIHQGKIRRIILKNEDGKTLIEIPLTLGLVGTALLPVFAAVGALAAVATRMVIVVEKVEKADPDEGDQASL